jgi:hypothetical protein
LLDVVELERALGGPAAARREALRRARGSARAAGRVAAKVAWHRPEVLRLTGRLHELRGATRAALGALGQAIGEAERLRMRPEAERAYGAAARILAQCSPEARCAGLDAATCRSKAGINI